MSTATSRQAFAFLLGALVGPFTGSWGRMANNALWVLYTLALFLAVSVGHSLIYYAAAAACREGRAPEATRSVVRHAGAGLAIALGAVAGVAPRVCMR